MRVRTLIRHAGPVIAAACVLASPGRAGAQVRFGVGIAVPGISIGINIPVYPHLVPVPGYPVYYAPNLDTNLFFYDGLYWIFANDQWYSSSWYDGPWYLVEPDMVPDFILRIPILYYRRPPVYFYRWNRYGAPRWGEHWGPRWERRRPGWDRWNRRSVPPRAPLPHYQREYPRGRYPDRARQRALENRYYQYRPRDRRDRRLDRLERMPGRTGPRAYPPPAQGPRESRARGNRFAPPQRQSRERRAPQRERAAAPQRQGRERQAPQRERAAAPQRQSRERQAPPRGRAAAPQRQSRERQAPPRRRAAAPQRQSREKQAPPREKQRDERPRRGEPPRSDR